MKKRKEDKLFILKYFLNIFTGVFLILGLLLLAFPLWISLDRNKIFSLLLSTGEHPLITTVSHVLLVSGSIVIFIGLMGCLGSLQEIRWLVFMGNRLLRIALSWLKLFKEFRNEGKMTQQDTRNFLCLKEHMGCLVLLIIMQAAAIVLLCTGKDMINLSWKTKMDQLISNYGNKHQIEKEQWDILNVFQRMLHCCGQHNFTDWKVNEHKEHVDHVPCSCTTLNTMKWFCDPTKDAVYTRGCANDIRRWYEDNIHLLIAINAGLLLVEVFQFIAATSMFRTMRKNVILPTN